MEAKSYMHRVGRTARAGRTGCAITLLTQYSALFFTSEIETHLLKEGGHERALLLPLVEPNSDQDKALEAAVEHILLDVNQAGALASKVRLVGGP
ncbi:unnamed protein product [Protopolystoma xenopodis]|uniref:Helicase C-terminal domain-containing protein n=1 Tax=Protopolystoma xenopodis TaxID=117903 RepID=A0A448WKJ1_9PLAT|nr:unnamed protein product [Protopolystoma xenopodis]